MGVVRYLMMDSYLLFLLIKLLVLVFNPRVDICLARLTCSSSLYLVTQPVLSLPTIYLHKDRRTMKSTSFLGNLSGDPYTLHTNSAKGKGTKSNSSICGLTPLPTSTLTQSSGIPKELSSQWTILQLENSRTQNQLVFLSQ